MLQLHPTNRNAGYSCVGSVCMSVILVPDQQPSHYCQRVGRHLYHFHIWLSTHVWNQDSRPAVIYVTASRDHQACCSTHVLNLCSETAGIFVTVALGHLARLNTSMHFCKICKHICCCGAVSAGMSVTLAPDPQLCLLCLYLTKGLLSTIAPDHQACMLQ